MKNISEKNINMAYYLMDRFGLDLEDKEFFWKIAAPIFEHEEFQRRMNDDEFLHHDTVNLGIHLLSDAIMTYKLAQRKGFDEVTKTRAVIIALFHDLYELPWQNNKIVKNRLVNSHGFVHPVEVAINVATWYPEYFDNEEEAEIIIDGIMHHMFPFPVRVLDGSDLELNNKEKFDRLNSNIKSIIINSSNRFKLGAVSICPSKFKEGRIMSKADKIVSLGKDLKTFNGVIACLTGHNSNL